MPYASRFARHAAIGPSRLELEEVSTSQREVVQIRWCATDEGAPAALNMGDGPERGAGRSFDR
jgi:hypothetical protein